MQPPPPPSGAPPTTVKSATKEQSPAAQASANSSPILKKTSPPSAVPQAPAAADEKTPLDLILNLTDDKPLNASDIADLQLAKKEIKFIRDCASEYLKNTDEEGEDDDTHDQDTEKNEHTEPRGALYDKQDFTSFEKTRYEKTDAVRGLIYDAIKPNVLFENNSKEEVLGIIEVFKPVSFKKGESVICQGDEGDDFFVVESGELSVHVTVRRNSAGGAAEEEQSEVKVGDYSSGSAFGELALIFGSPRAATIKATTDCRLWSVNRLTCRSVISQLKYEEYNEKKATIEKCVVKDRKFTDIFDASQIMDLTISTKTDIYDKGDVILREGEMGDTFYIVKSGEIETYRNDGEKMRTVEANEVFGTTSLLSGQRSQWTYQAASTVTVYYLTKQDFEAIMGSITDAFDGNSVAHSHTKAKARHSIKTSMTYFKREEVGLDQLTSFKLLGRGAFGQVTLVQSKETKKLYALKAQSKHNIAMKGQKEHVLEEYRVIKEIEHPFILGIHCAMQDKTHLYFLTDLLPGGDLMSYMVVKARKGTGFTEDVTRFYAASVVLAIEQLHSLMIAYRDLKPENIVLDKNGYGILVDFGLAKEITEGQTYTFCGTADYLAPEVISGVGHDWAVDYWCLGVFLFEMTNGTAPFYASNQTRRVRKIQKGFEFVRMPTHFSAGLSDLITNLLVSDQSKRLGRTQNGVQGIINHHWFAGFDWEGFKSKGLPAPIKPKMPEDLKTIGKKPGSEKHKHFQEAMHAPESDWMPDLS